MKSIRLRSVFATALAALVASSASVAACGGTTAPGTSPDGSVGPTPTSTSTTTSTTTTPVPDGGLPDGASPDGAVNYQAAACTLEDLTKGLDGARPAKAFDYVELRQTSMKYTDGGYEPDVSTALASSGTKCKNAPDAAACAAALAKAVSTKDLFPPTGGRQIPMARYFVVQSGADVTLVTTRAELVAFLGTIDAPSEAKLIVAADGYEPLCAADSVREVPGGYEVAAKKATECLNQYMGYVLNVTAAAVVTVKTTVDLRDPDAGCAVAGRRPEGFTPSVSAPHEPELLAYLGSMRQLEAASIPAFERLAEELRAHGAPVALIERAEEAARDEIRHAAGFSQLRRLHGAPAAERVELPAAAPWPARTLEALALENAAEGCVRETFGALVAGYQARVAADPRVRALFVSIAEDELRHAELAWDVAEWLDTQLDASARARVRQAEAQAALELELGIARSAPGRELRELCGVPARPEAERLFAGAAELWAA